MICTAPDCNQPTEKYICNTCTADLAAWLAKIPDLQEELFTTMSKLDKTAPQRHEGGGGLSTGSEMPIRAGAMESRAHLAPWTHRTATDLAADPEAGEYLPIVMRLVKQAEQLIDNPEEVFTFGPCGAETEDGPCPETLTAPAGATWTNCGACEAPHNVRHRTDKLKEEAKGEPLPPREARDYLREKAGISIKAKDFENWVYIRALGYVLDHVRIAEKPRDMGRRIYFPGEVFRIYRQMQERKNVA